MGGHPIPPLRWANPPGMNFKRPIVAFVHVSEPSILSTITPQARASIQFHVPEQTAIHGPCNVGTVQGGNFKAEEWVLLTAVSRILHSRANLHWKPYVLQSTFIIYRDPVGTSLLIFHLRFDDPTYLFSLQPNSKVSKSQVTYVVSNGGLQ